MEINGIGGAAGFGGGASKIGGGDAGGDGGFGNLFSSLMDGLESSQANADQAMEALALGEDVDIHEVVLATEMEALAFQLALQVRNRVVETVQTTLNMQV